MVLGWRLTSGTPKGFTWESVGVLNTPLAVVINLTDPHTGSSKGTVLVSWTEATSHRLRSYSTATQASKFSYSGKD